MRLPSNTYMGIYLVNPVTCRVEGCQINKTGGSTAIGDANAFGIYVYNGSETIKNNQISTSTPTGSGTGYGIFCGGSSHFVRGNEVDTCTVGVYMSAGKRQDNLTANCSTAFSGGSDAGGNN